MVNGRVFLDRQTPDAVIREGGCAFVPSNGKKSVLCGENPEPPGLQPDDIAGLKLPVPGCVDLNHGLTPARGQRNLGPLDRAECPDVPYRALHRAPAEPHRPTVT